MGGNLNIIDKYLLYFKQDQPLSFPRELYQMGLLQAATFRVTNWFSPLLKRMIHISKSIFNKKRMLKYLIGISFKDYNHFELTRL